jgi:beta-mannosidase
MLDEPENWHVKVVAGNDSLEDAEGRFEIRDADTEETLLEGGFTAKANENTELGRIRVFHSDKKLYLIQWTINGRTYGNHYLFGVPAFSFRKYKEWMQKIAMLAGDFKAEEVGK